MANEESFPAPKPKDLTMRVERQKPWEFRLRRKLKQWDRLFNGRDNGKEDLKTVEQDRRWGTLKRAAEIDRRIDGLIDSGATAERNYRFEDAELASFDVQANERALDLIRTEHPELYTAIESGATTPPTEEQRQEYEKLLKKYEKQELREIKEENGDDDKGYWTGNLELGELYDQYNEQFRIFYDQSGEKKKMDKFKGLRYSFRHGLAGGEGGDEYESSNHYFKIFQELVNDVKFYQLNKHGDTVEVRDLEAEKATGSSATAKLELFKGELGNIDQKDILDWADHLVQNRLTAQDVRNGVEQALMGCPSKEYVARVLSNLKSGGKIAADAKAELDLLGDMLADTTANLSHIPRAIDELDVSGSAPEKAVNTLKRMVGDISDPMNMATLAGFAIGATILYKMFGKESNEGFFAKALKTGGIAIGGALVGYGGIQALGALRGNQKTLADEVGASASTFGMESKHMKWIREKFDELSEAGDSHMKGITKMMGMSGAGFADICEWGLGTMDNDPARIADGLGDEIESNLFEPVKVNASATWINMMNVLKKVGQKYGIDKSKFGGDETDYLKACLAQYREDYDDKDWSLGTCIYDAWTGGGRSTDKPEFDLESYAMASPVIETVQAFAKDPKEVLVESVTGNMIRVNGYLWNIRENDSGEFDDAPERPLILTSVADSGKRVDIIPYGPQSRDWYKSRGDAARLAALSLVDMSNGEARNEISQLFADSNERTAPEQFKFNAKKNTWEFKDRKFSKGVDGFAQHLNIANEALPIEFMQDEKTLKWGVKIPGKSTLLRPDGESKLSDNIEAEYTRDLVLDRVRDYAGSFLGPLGSLELFDMKKGETEDYFKTAPDGGITLLARYGNGAKLELTIKDRQLVSWEVENVDDPALESARRLLSRQRAQEFRKGMEKHDAYKRYLTAYEGSGGDGWRTALSTGGEIYQQILQAAGNDKDLLYMRENLHVNTGNAVLDLLQVRYALEMEQKLYAFQAGTSGYKSIEAFYSEQDRSLDAEMNTIMDRALEIQGELEDRMDDDGAFATGRTRAALASSYPAKMMEIPAGKDIQCVWLLRETFALVDDPSKGFDMKGLDGAQQMTQQKAALAKAIFATYNVAAMQGLSAEYKWVRAKQIKHELVNAIRQDLRAGSASNLSFAGITIDKVFDVDAVVSKVKTEVGTVQEFKASGYNAAVGTFGASVPENAPTAADLARRPVIKMTELIDTDQMLHGPTELMDETGVDWSDDAEVKRYLDKNIDFYFTPLKSLAGIARPYMQQEDALLNAMIRLKKAQIQRIYGREVAKGEDKQAVAKSALAQLSKDMNFVSPSGNAYMASFTMAEHMLGGYGSGSERYSESLSYAFEHLVRLNTGRGAHVEADVPLFGTTSVDFTEYAIDADAVEQGLSKFLRKLDAENEDSSDKAVVMEYTQYYFACLGKNIVPKSLTEFSKIKPEDRIKEIEGYGPKTARLIEFERSVEGMTQDIGDWGGPFEAYAQARFSEIPADENFESNYQNLLAMVEEEHRIFELISAQDLTPNSEFDEESWNPTTKGLFPSGWQVILESLVGFDFTPIDNVKIGHLVFASIAKQRDKAFTTKAAYRAGIKADLKNLIQADSEDVNGTKLFNAF